MPPNTELHSNVVDRKDKGDKEEKVLSTNATAYKSPNFGGFEFRLPPELGG